MLGRKRKLEQHPGMPALYTGMRVEVLTPVNQLLFIGRAAVMKDLAIQITEEDDQDVPWVEYNTKVKLRGFQKDGTPISLFGYVCGSSEKFWKIDRLEILQKEEQRKFYRQTINLQGTVMYVNQIFSQGAGKMNSMPSTMPCAIVDISGGGARICCGKEAQFQVGDWLFLGMDDPLQGDSRLNFTCCIRRATETSNGFEYGCEFDGMTQAEQERLLRIVMMVQQRELRARRRSEI